MNTETLNIIIVSSAGMAALGLICGLGLAYAAERFKVEVDPKVSKILSILPGSNCGACGYPSCFSLAEAMVKGEAPTTSCKLGGQEAANKACEALGIEEAKYEPLYAVIQCGAGREKCKEQFEYQGVSTCQAAVSLSGGPTACSYGCVSYGDCIAVCPTNAITSNGKLPPNISKEKCIGCGKCVEVCPRKVIKLFPNKQCTFVLCTSQDKGAQVRKICSVGCIACRICVKNCPEGAMTMEGRIPVVDPDKCSLKSKCIETCPQKTIVNIS